MPGSLWLPGQQPGCGCCVLHSSLGVQGRARGVSCAGDLPSSGALWNRNSFFIFAEFSLSFNLADFQFALEVCFVSQSESVFVSLIKGRPVLAEKYEPDSQPSCALGSISIDCSRLGSILIPVKIL